MSEFTREELWGLEERAKRAAAAIPNPAWKLAYEQLHLALSTVDAFIARSSDVVETVTGTPTATPTATGTDGGK